ncbi:MAG TPA: tetratricopeptide repeat protein, partial [Bacteroidetes bacterium]|nr:tetratricopeptide repeat protein [Bacteroidota bacterium]
MFSQLFRILLLIFALQTAARPLVAQTKLRKAQGFYQAGAYQEAIRRYTRFLKKHENLEARLNLARSYRALGKLDQAESHFGQVIAHPKSLPEHKFELARLLKAEGKYEKAQTWFEKFAQESSDPSLGLRWAKSCKTATRLKQDSLGFQIRRIPNINSKASEISPVVYKSGIAFASTRKRGFLFRSFNRKSKLPFYDLYFAQKSPGGRLKKPVYLRQNLNTRLHDGPIIFSRPDNVAFITRSNSDRKGRKRDAAGFRSVNIYRIENKLDRWSKGESVPFNSKEYNLAHPAISRDGNTLYFTSDMPGGFGGTDLYVSHLRGETWTKPQNLGAEINSEANEGYPFLSNDSTLYFSSDRAEGFGGKDIFYAHLEGGTWANARNAGYPLNTSSDDFAFSIRGNSPYGYFSSNRNGSQGDDDIFGFRRFRGIDGTVVDSRTGKPLAGARIEIQGLNLGTKVYETGADGTFRHYLRQGQEVLLAATAAEHYKYKGTVSVGTVGFDENLRLKISLESVRRFMVEGIIKDAQADSLLGGVLVRIIGKQEQRIFTDKNGKYKQELESGVEYTAIFYKPGYQLKVVDLSTVGAGEAKHYFVNIEMKKGRSLLLAGMVSDQEKGRILPNANIHIFDAHTQKKLQAFTARSDGMFWKALPANQDYSIVATRQGYLSHRLDIVKEQLVSDTVQARMELMPLQANKVVKVVYHQYNSSQTDILGRRDLNEIAYLLLDNPEISVALSSHTDSRGSSRFNRKLSQERANSMSNYLVSRGISRRRIIAKGYGESKLYNKCSNGKSCSDELHAQNRRTEVKIVRIDQEIMKEKDKKNQEILKGKVPGTIIELENQPPPVKGSIKEDKSVVKPAQENEWQELEDKDYPE